MDPEIRAKQKIYWLYGALFLFSESFTILFAHFEWFQAIPFFHLSSFTSISIFYGGGLFLMGFVPIEIYRRYVEEHLKRDHERHEYQLNLISLLDELLREKHPVMEYHSKRVAKLARSICERINLSAEETRVIVFAALFHDIGKVFLENRLIESQHRVLDDADRINYERHVFWGSRMLSTIETYPGAGEIVKHHHERWDGKGYPDGVAGKDILLGARIIAVADTYDSMIYGLGAEQAAPVEEALERLHHLEGSELDPHLVDILGRIVHSEYWNQHVPKSFIHMDESTEVNKEAAQTKP